MAINERDCFTEKPETRPARLSCPKCRRTDQYQVRWMVRRKKLQIPRGADERDRALWAKLRDYMIRVDDNIVCRTCGRKFEIASHQSLVFLDEIVSMPDVEDEEEGA